MWYAVTVGVMLALMLFVQSAAWRWAKRFRAGRQALDEQSYAKAEEYLRDALRLSDQPGHQAAARAALAESLHRTGQLEEADRLLRRAIELFHDCFPEGHAEIARAYSLRGELCLDQGAYTDAQRCFQHALAEDQRIGNQARMLFTMQRLTEALLRQGNQPRALTIAEDCAVLEKVFMTEVAGDDAYIAMSLPGLRFCRGEWDDARRLYREKVTYFERLRKPLPGVDVGQYQLRLAAASESAGDMNDAARFYQQAAETYKRDYVADHPRVGVALVHLARVLARGGEPQQAEAVFGEARAMLTRRGLQNHPELNGEALAA